MPLSENTRGLPNYQHKRNFSAPRPYLHRLILLSKSTGPLGDCLPHLPQKPPLICIIVNEIKTSVPVLRTVTFSVLQDVKMPESFSVYLSEFMTGLLRKNPTERLGFGESGFVDL